MKKTINAAIQVLPQSATRHPYEIVDEAISQIRESGIKYEVCPFETVVEGSYDEVIALIGKIKDRCFSSGAEEILVNIKLQISKAGNVTIEDKTGKYR